MDKKKNHSFTIESEGDLEVIVLRETHCFLASLMHPDIFEIAGKSPNQNIAFKSHASFNLFLILITEFFSEGLGNYKTKGKYSNMSLSKGIKWFCTIHPKESKESGLHDNFTKLEEWVTKEHEYNFYCPTIGKEIKVYLSRIDLFNFCSNITKHNIFRLNILLNKLDKKYRKHGYVLDYSEVLSTLDVFEEHIRGAMEYYASYLIELFGHVFFSLNEIICKRYKKQGTNDANKMEYPKNISSDIFRDLYSSTLVFQSYKRDRVKKYTPTTGNLFKKDYMVQEKLD